MAARRIGALRTLVVGETAGLAGYLTLFALGHFSLHGVGSTAWLLVLAGVIAVAGYLAMYRGLESGHVGLVSAITACYGGVIAVLSVVLLGERLTAAAAVGVAATVVGVMLAVLRRTPAPAALPAARSGSRRPRRPSQSARPGSAAPAAAPSPPAPAPAAPASAPSPPAPAPAAPASAPAAPAPAAPAPAAPAPAAPAAPAPLLVRPPPVRPPPVRPPPVRPPPLPPLPPLLRPRRPPLLARPRRPKP